MGTEGGIVNMEDKEERDVLNAASAAEQAAGAASIGEGEAEAQAAADTAGGITEQAVSVEAAFAEAGNAAAAATDAGAPTPEEAFLLQVLSEDDLAELRDKELAEERAAEEEEELSPEERQAKAEHDALAAAFDMVRSRSNTGKLTTPGNWTAEGLVPEHLIPVDFCDIAFDTIIAAQAESAERAQAAEEAKAAAEAAQAEAQAAADAAEGTEAADGAAPADAEAGTEATPASEPAADSADAVAPAEPDDAALEEPEWQLDDIKVLEGKQTYLYSSDYMTDTYAHWAFLAEEGNDVLTLVDNARTESRLYPRPMLASSLSNKPYYWDADKIAAAWQAVQDSGEYPDMQTCQASNGDQYFYSTDYLSTPQAKALAEWYSVDRQRSV